MKGEAMQRRDFLTLLGGVANNQALGFFAASALLWWLLLPAAPLR
jgi:hypothetical protein